MQGKDLWRFGGQNAHSLPGQACVAGPHGVCSTARAGVLELSQRVYVHTNYQSHHQALAEPGAVLHAIISLGGLEVRPLLLAS